MELKPTLEFQDQLDLLKSRKLLIPDETKALSYLKFNSYYHLNIYFKHFQQRTGFVDSTGRELFEFKEGCEFDHIVKIHEDDKALRGLYLEALQPVELLFRTTLSYYIGIKKGSGCFYLKDPKLYYDLNRIERLRERFEDILRSSGSNPIVQHHAIKYSGRYPLFVIFELTSFNFLVEFFECLTFGFQNSFATRFFLLKNAIDLKLWFRCINDLRNVCAHQNYLFTRLFNADPVFQDNSLLYSFNKKTLFAYTIVMGYFSKQKEWLDF